jgi:hypothetical protein
MVKTAAMVLVALAVTAGCGGPVDHIDYWVDATVPAKAAADACAAWRTGVGVECTRVLAENANVLLTAYSGGPDVGGQTETWKQPISIKINMSFPAHVSNDIAHEFGHALGLGHLDSAPALMNTDDSRYAGTALTDVDIAGWMADGHAGTVTQQ